MPRVSPATSPDWLPQETDSDAVEPTRWPILTIQRGETKEKFPPPYISSLADTIPKSLLFLATPVSLVDLSPRLVGQEHVAFLGLIPARKDLLSQWDFQVSPWSHRFSSGSPLTGLAVGQRSKVTICQSLTGRGILGRLVQEWWGLESKKIPYLSAVR